MKKCTRSKFTKNEIIKSTAQALLIYSSSAPSLSATKIAEKNGVTQALINYYFGTRIGLIYQTMNYLYANDRVNYDFIVQREKMCADSFIHAYLNLKEVSDI